MTDRPTGDLTSERDFAFRSLEDLEREHEAGDVDDADYEVLRSSYVERAAAVLRAISSDADADADAGSPSSTPRATHWSRFRRALGRRRTRRVLGVASVLLLVVALGLFALELAGVRLPGEDPTGSINLPQATKVQEELAEANTAANTGNITAAVETYDAVLAVVPNQRTALTYRGWLVRLAGVQDHDQKAVANGDASLARAVVVAPGYPDARALDGIALYQDRSDVPGALRQFAAFLADKPSTTLLAEVGPEIAPVYTQAGVAVPKALKPYETNVGPAS